MQVAVSGSVDTTKIGTYTLTYTATDRLGNRATATRTVRVVDTTPPTIRIKGDNPAIVEVGSTYTDAGATALDTVDGNLTNSIATTNSVNTNRVGDYNVTYSVKDSAGNEVNATRVVRVVDTPPTITIKGANPATIEVGSTYIDAGAEANDNVDGNLTNSITTTSNVNTTKLGDYNVTYTVQDSAGNEVNATRVVRVRDTTPPTITLNHINLTPISGLKDINLAQIYGVATQGSYQGSYRPGSNTIDGDLSTINHTKDGNNENWLQVKLPVDAKINKIVVYNRTSFASRLNNAKVSLQNSPYSGTLNTNDIVGTLQGVITPQEIKFTTPKSANYIILKADNNYLHIRELEVYGTLPTLKVGDTFTDPGATATDNADSNVQVTVSGTVNTNRVGTYTLTYTATDSSGNEANATRIISVVDTTPPTITLNNLNLAPIPGLKDINLAQMYGVATQGTPSSYQYYKPASNVIDGDLSTNNHTSNSNSENWLQIKLPANAKINKIVVINITGSIRSRLLLPHQIF